MSYGLQVRTPSGEIRLENTELLHRLVAQGAIAVPGPYRTVTVSYPGMTPTDQWFIVVAGDAVCHPGYDQFSITCYGWYEEIAYYSVYKR